MSKYVQIMKMELGRTFDMRANILLWRVRNIVVILTLYFVWLNLSMKTGRFAGFTASELMTYVIGANLIRGLVFGAHSSKAAEEINSGQFSHYLTKPVNYFYLMYFRGIAERSFFFLFSLIEGAFLVWLLGIELVIQRHPIIVGLLFLSLLIANLLYFILTYAVSLIAFWSREAMGPRFLFDWLLEFASGAYFPLSILSNILYSFLACLPFYYLIYFPMVIYLGKLNFPDIWGGIAFQLFWILAAGAVTIWIWKKGLKRYGGEGI